MTETFANLPSNIEQAIQEQLDRQDSPDWISRAVALHTRYTERHTKGSYLKDMDDIFAYLALRTPATYAQIHAACSAICEMIPSWKPVSVLDIGSGPGTGVWAAKDSWESIVDATCVDAERNFITIGRQLTEQSQFSISVTWEHKDVRGGLDQSKQYDLVIISNVLNELTPASRDKLLGQAFNSTSGVLLVVEPGTPEGSIITQTVAKQFRNSAHLVAPYIDNSLVQKEGFWLHFSQKFIRPEFERRIRQHMRDNSEMASDWEEAKFSYVALSKLSTENAIWGRCIGPIQNQKGFIELPVLTKDAIETIRVMKRHPEQYHYAKELKWGDVIPQKEKLITSL